MNCLLISVIVPIFNADKYLSECINSIVCQTYKNIEIILVDDGSTDNSKTICEYYGQFDQRIKYYKQENSGVSSARNKGLELSNGEIIMFVDADDYLNEECISYYYNQFIENKVGLYIGGFVSFSKNYNKIFSQNKSMVYNSKMLFYDMNRKFHSEWIGVVWGKLYWKKIIDKNNLCFDVSLNFGEDACFNFQYISKIELILFDTGCEYNYRVFNANSLSREKHKDLYEIHNKVYNIKSTVMKTVGCNDSFINKYCALAFINDLCGYYMCDLFDKNDRINNVKKVANNIYIKNVELLKIHDIKKIIIVLLLRYRCYDCVDYVLCKYYKCRSRKVNEK